MKLSKGSPQPPTRCDQVQLATLLEGDDSQLEFQKAALHVERCEHCQQQLTELAGQHHEWEQISDFLRSYSDGNFVASEQSTSADVNHSGSNDAIDHSQLRAHLDSLLETPRHPEMLGRLGRYEIEGVIGSGGMGIVLRGFDTELHRPVAIKILAQHLAYSGAARQRFARESRAAAAVVHEHVVAIHDVDTDGKTPYLVMQYIAGESLQARVDRDGPLTPREVLRIGAQTAAGLHAAHSQGVIHRDIKPANILLERGVERVLVTDFGLARTVDDASLTHTGVIAGTPHYMSPEQALGQTSDFRTDLFSLGSVLYYMASGHAPFRAEKAMAVLNRICHEPHRPVWEVNSEIPDDLSDVIDRLLSKKASRRFSSADEVHQQLNRILASLQQPRSLNFRKSRRWFRSHATTLWTTLAGSLLFLALTMSLTTYLRVVSPASRLEAASDGAPAASLTGPSTQSPSMPLNSTNSPTHEERTYSIETWQLATRDDRQAWQAKLEELSRQLDTQQLPDGHRSESQFESAWERELGLINQRLETLQNSL